MSYHEFVYWQAFNILEPIGILRDDILHANIAKTIVDSKIPEHGLEFEHFMMFKEPVVRTVDDVCDDIKARMASFMA